MVSERFILKTASVVAVAAAVAGEVGPPFRMRGTRQIAKNSPMMGVVMVVSSSMAVVTWSA